MNNYKYTKNWFLVSELKQLAFNYLDNKKKYNILEIGCYEGLSSVFLADNFLNHPESSLNCVDPFMTIDDNDHNKYLNKNVENNFDHNITNCKNSIKINVNKITSDEFFKNNDKYFNFIYIDGCHEEEFIKRDIKNSFKYLVKDGIIWMDDYGGYTSFKTKISNIIDSVLNEFTNQYEILHKNYQLVIKKL